MSCGTQSNIQAAAQIKVYNKSARQRVSLDYLYESFLVAETVAIFCPTWHKREIKLTNKNDHSYFFSDSEAKTAICWIIFFAIQYDFFVQLRNWDISSKNIKKEYDIENWLNKHFNSICLNPQTGST